MLAGLLLIVLPLCCFAADGRQDGLPQESGLGTELLNANKLDLQNLFAGSEGSNAYQKEIQRRNLRLYPEWFSQRIKKLVAKRFAHNGAIATDHKKTGKDEVPTPKVRRSSLYGISPRNQILVADDVGDSSVAPQPLTNLPAGSELVDLPPNYQALSPDAFHDVSYGHGKLLAFVLPLCDIKSHPVPTITGYYNVLQMCRCD